VDKNRDLSITSQDLAEIFGIGEPATGNRESTDKAKQAGAGVPAQKAVETIPVETKTLETKPEKKSIIVTSKLVEMGAGTGEKVQVKKESIEDDYEVDDLIKRAEKIKQELEREAIPQATTPAPAQEPFSAEIDYKDEKNIGELAGAFDELRKIIQEELTVSCGERAAKAMLLKTLEKTAFGNFVFKNTNWDSDGKLREDGMIDMERLVRNIKILGPTVRLKTEIEEGMIGLLYMRLKAVKLGLGQEKYEAVKARIINRIHVIEAGYSRDIMGIIKNNIIAPSLKKGDEEI
jgi:hypothetical protein